MYFLLLQTFRASITNTNRHVNGFGLQFNKSRHQQLENERQTTSMHQFCSRTMENKRNLSQSSSAQEELYRKTSYLNKEMTSTSSQLEMNELDLRRYFWSLSLITVIFTKMSVSICVQLILALHNLSKFYYYLLQD